MSDPISELEQYFKDKGCDQQCYKVFHMTNGRHKTNCYLHEDNLLKRVNELEQQLAEKEPAAVEPIKHTWSPIYDGFSFQCGRCDLIHEGMNPPHYQCIPDPYAAKPAAVEPECPACKGTGYTQYNGPEDVPMSMRPIGCCPCSACNGTGKGIAFTIEPAVDLHYDSDDIEYGVLLKKCKELEQREQRWISATDKLRKARKSSHSWTIAWTIAWMEINGLRSAAGEK